MHRRSLHSTQLMKRKNSGLWAHLEAIGILRNGTPQEIERARSAYRREYNRRYAARYRERNEVVRFTLTKRQCCAIRTLHGSTKIQLSELAKHALLASIEQGNQKPSNSEWRELVRSISQIRSGWERYRSHGESGITEQFGRELRELDDQLRGRLFQTNDHKIEK